jgi:DnaJ-class molecular chaperone
MPAPVFGKDQLCRFCKGTGQRIENGEKVRCQACEGTGLVRA